MEGTRGFDIAVLTCASTVYDITNFTNKSALIATMTNKNHALVNKRTTRRRSRQQSFLLSTAALRAAQMAAILGAIVPFRSNAAQCTQERRQTTAPPNATPRVFSPVSHASRSAQGLKRPPPFAHGSLFFFLSGSKHHAHRHCHRHAPFSRALRTSWEARVMAIKFDLLLFLGGAHHSKEHRTGEQNEGKGGITGEAANAMALNTRGTTQTQRRRRQAREWRTFGAKPNKRTIYVGPVATTQRWLPSSPRGR